MFLSTHQLLHYFNTILNDFNIFTISVGCFTLCHTSVVSVYTGFAQQTFIPYKKTFGLNFLQGRTTRIDTTEKYVVLDSGKVLINVSLKKVLSCNNGIRP